VSIFIREKRRTNMDGSTVTYLRPVENRRVGDKVRRRVLCTLGRPDDSTLPRRLKALAELILSRAGRYREVEVTCG